MDELLDAIATLVSLVSPEKVQAVAARVRRTDASRAATTLPSIVGTPVASTVVAQLAAAWQNTKIGSDELALMLLAASHVYFKATSEQSTELVWTGPTTPFVSARRTEQALLQVINTAQRSIFVTSFVAHNVPPLIKALNDATERGVEVSILLESPRSLGGKVNVDSISTVRGLLSRARVYTWRSDSGGPTIGSVHAKVAVADGWTCFITSANMTEHAMRRNIEVGVLISGGAIPRQLHEHLHSLVSVREIVPLE